MGVVHWLSLQREGGASQGLVASRLRTEPSRLPLLRNAGKVRLARRWPVSHHSPHGCSASETDCYVLKPVLRPSERSVLLLGPKDLIPLTPACSSVDFAAGEVSLSPMC